MQWLTQQDARRSSALIAVGFEVMILFHSSLLGSRLFVPEFVVAALLLPPLVRALRHLLTRSRSA